MNIELKKNSEGGSNIAHHHLPPNRVLRHRYLTVNMTIIIMEVLAFHLVY